MSEQVVELRKEVQTLLTQVNDVIKENIYLIRELNELSNENGQFNSDLDKAAEQFNVLMSKLKVKVDEEIKDSENESAIIQSP